MKQFDEFTRIIEPTVCSTYFAGWHQLNVGARPIDEQHEYLKARGLSKLRFSFDTLFGYSPRDLSFLKDYKNVEAVQIGGNFHDFEHIKNLSNLKSFSDNVSNRKGMCFDHLYTVEDLSVDYESAHPKYEKFANLQSFDAARLPKRFADFSRFEFDGVKGISIASSPIRSLSGIERFKKLDKMLLHACRSLEGNHLDEVCENVLELRLQYCPKLSSVSFLNQFPNLTKLNLINCGSIASLEPILNLSKLERLFVENTRFEKGDILKLKGEMPNLRHLGVI